jgi:hypothetical protein
MRVSLQHRRLQRRLAACVGAEGADELVHHLPGAEARVDGGALAGGSSGFSNRTLPRRDSRMPSLPLMAATEVFLALLRVSATSYPPSAKPFCSKQASAQRLSASKSPSH